MLVGEDAYFMLLTKDRFAGFAKRPQGDPAKETNTLSALETAVSSEPELALLAMLVVVTSMIATTRRHRCGRLSLNGPSTAPSQPRPRGEHSARADDDGTANGLLTTNISRPP